MTKTENDRKFAESVLETLQSIEADESLTEGEKLRAVMAAVKAARSIFNGGCFV